MNRPTQARTPRSSALLVPSLALLALVTLSTPGDGVAQNHIRPPAPTFSAEPSCGSATVGWDLSGLWGVTGVELRMSREWDGETVEHLLRRSSAVGEAPLDFGGVLGGALLVGATLSVEVRGFLGNFPVTGWSESLEFTEPAVEADVYSVEADPASPGGQVLRWDLDRVPEVGSCAGSLQALFSADGAAPRTRDLERAGSEPVAGERTTVEMQAYRGQEVVSGQEVGLPGPPLTIDPVPDEPADPPMAVAVGETAVEETTAPEEEPADLQAEEEPAPDPPADVAQSPSGAQTQPPPPTLETFTAANSCGRGVIRWDLSGVPEVARVLVQIVRLQGVDASTKSYRLPAQGELPFDPFQQGHGALKGAEYRITVQGLHPNLSPATPESEPAVFIEPVAVAAIPDVQPDPGNPLMGHIVRWDLSRMPEIRRCGVDLVLEGARDSSFDQVEETPLSESSGSLTLTFDDDDDDVDRLYLRLRVYNRTVAPENQVGLPSESVLLEPAVARVPIEPSAQPLPVTPTPDDGYFRFGCLSTRIYRADDIDAIPGADGAEWELYREGEVIDRGTRPLGESGDLFLELILHDHGPVLDGTAYGVRIRATGGGDPVAEWSRTTRFDGTAEVASFDAGTNGVMLFSWDLGPVLSECANGGVLEIERDGVIVDTHEVGATAGSESRPLEEFAPGTYLARFRAHSGSTDPEDVFGLPANPVEFTIPDNQNIVQQLTPTPDNDRRGGANRCVAERLYRIRDFGDIAGVDGADWELRKDGRIVATGNEGLRNNGVFRLVLDLREYGGVLDGTEYSFRARATAGGEPAAGPSDPTVYDETAAVESFAASFDSSDSRPLHYSWDLGSPLGECSSLIVLQIAGPDGRFSSFLTREGVLTREGAAGSGEATVDPASVDSPGTYQVRAVAVTPVFDGYVGLPSDPVEVTVPEPLVETTPDPPEPEPTPVAVRIQALDRAAAACVSPPPPVTEAEIAVFLDEKIVATGKTGPDGTAFDLLPGVYRVVANAAHCKETTSELRVSGGSPINVPLEGCVSKAADLEVLLPYPRDALLLMEIRRDTGFPVGPLPLTAVVRNIGKGISGRAGLRIERVEVRRTVALGQGTRGVEPICAGEERTFTMEDPNQLKGATYTYRARIFTADARTDNNAAEIAVTAP